MKNHSMSKEYMMLFVLYSFSFILLLINFDGLYWDDWVVLNQTVETKKLFFSEFKNDVLNHFHIYFSSLNHNIFYYRLFVFFAYFFSGIFIYKILQTVKELSSKDIFYITLLYLLMPVISARIAISIIPFFFPVLIFYATFYLLTKYIKNNCLILRFIILAGFYISFYTNSILVYYALVLLYIYYIKYELSLSIENIKVFIIKYFDFIFLPILFFSIKVIFYKPAGLYADYNSVGNTSVFKIIFNLFKSIDTSIFNVIHQAFYISLPYWVLILFILFFYKKYKFEEKELYINVKSTYLFSLGVLIFILAVFPYAAVSKLPIVDNFSSRYQLLIPLALAFIIYFGINVMVKYLKLSIFFRQVLLIILIFTFIGKNIFDYYKFQVDSLYMTSIMMNLRDNEKVRDNTTFIVNNTIQYELMYQRKIPFYEWNGMLKKVFNNDSRLVVTYDEYKKITEMNVFKSNLQYNFSTWKKSNPIVLTLSKNYKTKMSSGAIFRMILLKYKDYNKYLKSVKNLTILSTEVLREK